MMQSGVPVEERIYKGTIDCAKKVAEAEGKIWFNRTFDEFIFLGVQGFFKGAGSNILRGLGGAIVLAVYDEFKKHLYWTVLQVNLSWLVISI